ncbi:MAG: four helix bundle protein [Phycisphaeraceae bacterium]
MSGRLRSETLQRVVVYGTRILELVERLERDRRPRRVIDRITGSGAAPGAMLFEASEAISRPDFLKCIGLAAKELNETRYWLELFYARRWLPSDEYDWLRNETSELLSMIKAMIARSRTKPPAP